MKPPIEIERTHDHELVEWNRYVQSPVQVCKMRTYFALSHTVCSLFNPVSSKLRLVRETRTTKFMEKDTSKYSKT